MENSSQLQQLIHNPVFEHIDVSRPDANSLRIYFGRIALINKSNIKPILLIGILTPILMIALGIALAQFGIKWGVMLSLIGGMAFCLCLLGIMFVGVYGTLMQLPDEIVLNEKCFAWNSPHRKIEIPWPDLVSIPAPLDSEKTGKTSSGREALLLTTVNGTFKALPMRSEKSCDYVAQLIHAFANSLGFGVQFNDDPTLTRGAHFPATIEERKEYKYKGPLVFLLVAGCFGWMAFSQIQEMQHQKSWTSHTAKVTGVVVGENDGNTTKDATYVYSINEKEYGGDYHWRDTPAYEPAREPIEGAVVDIKINPDNSAESKISRQPDRALLAFALVISGLCLLGAVYFWRDSRLPAQEAEKYSVKT